MFSEADSNDHQSHDTGDQSRGPKNDSLPDSRRTRVPPPDTMRPKCRKAEPSADHRRNHGHMPARVAYVENIENDTILGHSVAGTQDLIAILRKYYHRRIRRHLRCCRRLSDLLLCKQPSPSSLAIERGTWCGKTQGARPAVTTSTLKKRTTKPYAGECYRCVLLFTRTRERTQQFVSTDINANARRWQPTLRGAARNMAGACATCGREVQPSSPFATVFAERDRARGGQPVGRDANSSE